MNETSEGPLIHSPEVQERREDVHHGRRIEQVRGFVNVLGEYKTSLNSIAELPNLPETVEAHLSALHSDTGKDHTQDAEEVYKWYVKNFGGPARLLKEALPEDQMPTVHELVARNVAEFRQATANPDRIDRQIVFNDQMTQMASFLLEKSEKFDDVQKVLDKEALSLNQPTWKDNEEVLNLIKTVAEADEEISLLPPGEMEASIKSWIAQMASEARSGIPTGEGQNKRRKIYETPHYLGLLDALKRMGKRRNGVGGVILYGPPGTGKTELIREKNRREGFDTKVINVHKYIGFGDLFGERAASIKSDPGVQLATKLNIIIDHTDRLTGEQFGRSMTDLFEELRGTDYAVDSMGEFLLPNVSLGEENVMDILAQDELSSEDWDKIKQAYIAKQRSRLARTNLHEAMQEKPEEIIRGEIMLALKKSKDTGKPVRVLLDELDKAGPGSLGGMLTFLSQSPGETIDFGGVTEEIPSWFKVDATSNATELDSYLTDRFAGLQVDTPPAKDQLMIAAVRLSNTEGNILLNGYEQEQLAAFFIHVVPRVNQLLRQANQAPISNRLVQELTGNLVDFTNMTRTDMTMSEAFQSLIIDNRFWKKDTTLSGHLQYVLNREFGPTMHDKPKPQGRRERFHRPASASEGETATASSEPLLKTIAGLAESESAGNSLTIEEILLDDQQQQAINHAYAEKKTTSERNSTNRRFLKTGQVLQAQSGEGTTISLISIRNGESAHRLVNQTVPAIGSLADASADGTVVVLSSNREDAKQLTIVNSLGVNAEQMTTIDVRPGDEITLDDRGELIGALNPDGTLKIFSAQNGKTLYQYPGVDTYQFAPDGKTVLLKSRQNNQTVLVSTRTFGSVLDGPLESQKDHAWRFVGDHILAQIGTDGAVAQSARYVA